MNCPKCTTENDQSTKFCKNCGTNLQPKPEATAGANSNLSDVLLFIFLMTFIFTVVSEFLIQKIFEDWFMNTGVKYTLGIVWFLRSLSFILVPISIKNTTLKILGIVFMSLVIIYYLYRDFSFVFNIEI